MVATADVAIKNMDMTIRFGNPIKIGILSVDFLTINNVEIVFRRLYITADDLPTNKRGSFLKLASAKIWEKVPVGCGHVVSLSSC